MAEYTFFFGPDNPFSQWHPSVFVVADDTFSCAEQFMMHGKAMLFGDTEVAAELFTKTHPRDHKALGRKVKNFDDKVWKRERETIVMAGSRAKFTQNPPLLEVLLATRGTELVEASPFDKIWGIGIGATDPRAHDPAQWKGLNLLGKILTTLRDELDATASQR